MKKAVVIILVFILIVMMILIYSCGNKPHAENLPDLSDIDHVRLSLKMDFDSLGHRNIKTIEVSDAENISDLKNTLSPEPFQYLYCTSSGMMDFYKDSSLVLSVVFNTEQGQRHIAFNRNGKLTAIKLADENAKLLESFKIHSN